MRAGINTDYVGKVFGKLTVIARAVANGGKTLLDCKCSCGALTRARAADLLSGNTTSCGCYKRERGITHGLTDSPEYKARIAAISRCENPSYPGFKDYGGRGIKLCDRWRKSFEDFFADMGERPSAMHSLDRIDVNGDYEPGNCRWATSKQQGNNRRTNVRLTIDGDTKTLAEWADATGINQSTFYDRVMRSACPEALLFRHINNKRGPASEDMNVPEEAFDALPGEDPDAEENRWNEINNSGMPTS